MRVHWVDSRCWRPIEEPEARCSCRRGRDHLSRWAAQWGGARNAADRAPCGAFGPSAGSRHPVQATCGRAAIGERGPVDCCADPRVGCDRISRRRVPVSGFPVRRPRRRGCAGSERSDRTECIPVRANRRHVHVSDEPDVREQRCRLGRVPGQAARRSDRFPRDPQHDKGSAAGRIHVRARWYARS